MTLRRRVGLAAGAAVGLAIVLASIVCYLVVRGQLRNEVDSALDAQYVAIHNGQLSLGQQLPGIPASAGGSAQYYQIVGSDGSTLVGNLALPISSQTVRVANGTAGTYKTDVMVNGSDLRELTFFGYVRTEPFAGYEPVAVQLARPLDPANHILYTLRLILALLCVGGVALAAALGRLAARRVLAPLAEVAETAQHISETEDLTSRIHVHADDEVGQLATRFNAMIERLEGSRAELDDSVRAQRQLVADASHELRTPVTSLRTNIEVLLAGGELSEEDRRRLLNDVVEQSEELTGLVSDLIELARGDLQAGTVDDVRLDGVVAQSLARARRNGPGLRFEDALEPMIVDGVPERLERAVNNLLDNATRHSPPGGTIEVVVDGGGVRIRDHGPGIAPEDLPYVFDRFYRGVNTRGAQGSGLGLAIVRQVAEQHGGSVEAANHPEGGAVFTLHLPTVPIDGPDPTPRPLWAEPSASRG